MTFKFTVQGLKVDLTKAGKLLRSYPLLAFTAQLVHGEQLIADIDISKTSFCAPFSSAQPLLEKCEVETGLEVRRLPVGSILCVQLRGLRSKSTDPQKAPMVGWATVKPFSFDRLLKTGDEVVPFWLETSSLEPVPHFAPNSNADLSLHISWNPFATFPIAASVRSRSLSLSSVSQAPTFSIDERKKIERIKQKGIVATIFNDLISTQIHCTR